MSIKGTLETFNLCELLQMLAFNQKEGTLLLEAEGGVRSIYLDSGKLTFLEQDADVTASVVRMARRNKVGTDGRLRTAIEKHDTSGRNLPAILQQMDLLDAESAEAYYKEAAIEQLFEAQLTAVAGFEFVEGRALRPDGSDGRPIQPALAVESLLLDLARMLDHWNSVTDTVPGPSEIYEGTGIAVDFSDNEDLDGDLAAMVVPLIDGYSSLSTIAERCSATEHSVMLIAAALVAEGGIRAVPTEDLMHRAQDLLARAEPHLAQPLLLRCIERGDAPLEVRLRLADALEASNQPAEAAAELDTFAALSEDDAAPAVFEALSRALRLREGDFATAARVCDYYIRWRPWLHEYRNLATQALRDLIHGATTNGRPLDAATRLKAFIECGDAPSEDLLLLADLSAAGGEHSEAAAALYKRCEELLATDRKVPARQLLRRVLELDAGHADARRLQLDLDGVRRRRGHRARIVVIILMLGGVIGGATILWSTYRESASTEISDFRLQARDAVIQAEKKANALMKGFQIRADGSALLPNGDDGLGDAASEMRSEVRAAMASTTAVLNAYLSAIDKYEPTGRDDTHRNELRRLTNRRQTVNSKAAGVVDAYAHRARNELIEALKQHKAGQFEEARKLVRSARTLSFDDLSTQAGAGRLLGIIDEYFKSWQEAQDRMLAATARGDLRGAFLIGAECIRDLYDSDLTRKLPFPVSVSSRPGGAEVWLSGKDTGLRTPCILTYSPFVERPVASLRMAGRTSVNEPLPSYTQIRRDLSSIRGWEPRVSGVLVPGPRWRVGDPIDRFYALWGSGPVPLVAGGKGRVLYAASPADGRLVPGAKFPSGDDPIRLGGRAEGGLEWYVRGIRTLTVRPPAGKAWETTASGRLDRPPLYVDELIVVVDERGIVLAFDAQTGTAQWRTQLTGPPAQAPIGSKVGILLATTGGATYRVDPQSPRAIPLAPALRGWTFALPFGEGAVVLGGGTMGCRRVDAGGKVTVLGDALPRTGSQPWLGPEGVAWIESDGVRWLASGSQAPIKVTGLGRNVDYVGGGSGQLYATGADGTLRAVSLTRPDQALWIAPLGGRSSTPPLRLGDAIFLLVSGRLVAVEV